MNQKLHFVRSFPLKTMFIALLMLGATRSFSQTVFVAPTGTGTGATWGTAYTTLTAALASGATKIYVKAGTYSGTYTLPATHDIYIKGSYPIGATGTDTSGYNATSTPTTLDAAASTSAAIFTVPSGTSTGYNVTLVGLVLTNDNYANSSAFNEANSTGFTNAINYSFQQLVVTKNNTGNTANGLFYLRNVPAGSVVQFNGCLFGGANADASSNTSATNVGSAIVVDNLTGGFSFLVDKCGFTNNGTTTGIVGGAIRVTGNASSVASGTYTISNSTFCNNMAGQYGGAIALYALPTVNVANCNFKLNTGSSGAGAIYVQNAGLNATGCVFDQNGGYGVSTIDVESNGGASAGLGPVQHIDNCTFYSNTCISGQGTYGAVHLNSCYNGFTVNGSKFYNNINSYYAGAITIDALSTNGTISGSTFSGNQATNTPGDIYYFPSGSYTVDLSGNNLQGASSADYQQAGGYTFGTNTYNYSTTATEPTITCATPTTIILPITGLSLTAQIINGTPQLNWTTLTEQNTSYFTVQSSADGSSFTTIGKVAAAGNSNAILNYTFTDNAATGSVVYYRIQTVDKDGAVTISNVVAIRLSNAVAVYNVYPNPAINLVNIETGMAGNYLVEMFTNDGRKVQAANISTVSGLVSFNINRSGITTGVYVVKTTNTTTGSSNYSTILLK